MYERFTDRARTTFQLANQEANRLGHDYIGTEHILLGLIIEGTGVAATVLKTLGLDLRKACLEVEKLSQDDDETTLPDEALDPTSKKIVEYAMEEARDLKLNYVGTEHLLLGLLRAQEGIAGRVLTNCGVTPNAVRKEISNLTDESLSESRTVTIVPDSISAFEENLSIKPLLASLGQLQIDKEDAISKGKFDRAAHLRDRQAEIREKLSLRIEQLSVDPDAVFDDGDDGDGEM